MPKINYQEIWKDKAEGAPKQSIIGSLQKLLAEKEDQISTLTEQLNALKTRMNETTEIIDQMERQFTTQQARIQELEAQVSGRPVSPSLSSTKALSGADKAQLDALNGKIRDLENRNYILNQKSVELETQVHKKDQLIAQYQANEKKYMDMLEKASEGATGGSDGLVHDLQSQVNQLQKQVMDLETQKSSLETQLAAARASTPGGPAAPSISKFKPAAPTIRMVEKDMSSDKEKQMAEELEQLRKQLAERDSEIAQLTRDINEIQTQLAQAKAAGPKSPGETNMMSMLNELQMKNKKIMERMQKKEDEIRILRGLLGDKAPPPIS